MKVVNILFIVFGLVFLISCQNNNENIVETYPKDQDLARKMSATSMINDGKGIVFFGGDIDSSSSATVKSSSDLWRKSMDVLSDALPILIADRESGVIATDWGIIEKYSGNNKKYKINAIVKNDGINLKVFSENGSNDDVLAEKIKEKII